MALDLSVDARTATLRSDADARLAAVLHTDLDLVLDDDGITATASLD